MIVSGAEAIMKHGILNAVNQEVGNLMKQLKMAQKQVQEMLKTKDIVNQAKKYANTQSAEVRKVLASDAKVVKAFLEKEKCELSEFQKQINTDVKKLSAFVLSQRKDFEKLIRDLSKKKVTKTALPKAKKK